VARGGLVIGEGPGYEPETLSELCDLVRDAGKVLLRRNDTYTRAFRVPGPTGHFGHEDDDLDPDWHVKHDAQAAALKSLGYTYICSEAFREIVEYDVTDQVVRVQADIPLGNLNAELAKHGQCIPLCPAEGGDLPWALHGESIGTLVSMNLPHGLGAQCGSWRDWILGMTVVLADGTVAKGGSKAVKNVAGYDVQKLFVGARDTLGIVYEVTLRTFPLKALPTPRLEKRMVDAELERRRKDMRGLGWWIQRTSASEWEQALAVAGEDLVVADRASRTLYAILPAERDLARYPGDWVIRSGCGAKNLQITDPTETKFMKRAKEIFDPTGKLNPGEMGIF